MRNLIKTLLIATFILGVNESSANTLFDSLNSAYLNNSKLNAERAKLRATIEGKGEALSEFKPSITISGYISEQDNTGTEGVAESNYSPSEKSLLIEQKIFQGFGGVANLKKEKYEFSLSQFKLKKIEQEILLAAAEVHTDYLLNQKKVVINNINIDLLERQVETDQARLEKGEIGLTDLAQSESSLAGARAKLIAAENDLITNKTNFEKIIGKNPSQNITDDIKEADLQLPKNLAEAYVISDKENPDLKIASLEYKKSEQDIIIARSDLSPSATLSYEIAEQDNFSSTVEKRTQQTVKATASWPLYSGGSNISNLKKKKELRNQKKLLLQDSKKTIKTTVANAWSVFQSSGSVLDSIRSQVKAAEIANEGITQEYETGGDRTTLDVIQSRAILLEARLNLASSERNFLLSQFKLLSAMGHLTADHLNLKSE